MVDETKSLVLKIKNKATELGIPFKQEVFEVLSKSIQLLPAIVGNELVMATFVPMLPSLIYDSVKRDLLEKNISDLGERLSDEKENLNKDFINSPLGKKLFKDTISEILEQTDEEKREYHKRFLINCYTTRDVNEQRMSAFMRILSSSEPIELKILGALGHPQETANKIIQNIKVPDGGIPMALKDQIMRLLESDKELFERAVVKLESEKFINTKGEDMMWISGGYTKEHEKEARENMIKVMSRILTDFGGDFIKYALTENQVPSLDSKKP